MSGIKLDNKTYGYLQNLDELRIEVFVKAINKIRLLFSKEPILYSLFERMMNDGDFYNREWIKIYKTKFVIQLFDVDENVNWEKHLFDLVFISMKIGRRSF